jgi:hypothetical protein
MNEEKLKEIFGKAAKFLCRMFIDENIPIPNSLIDFKIEFVTRLDVERANYVYRMRFENIQLNAEKHVDVMIIASEGKRYIVFADEKGDLLDFRETSEAYKHIRKK